MKEGYKLCPYCANEIKEGAIKCQYCEEFLDGRKATNESKKKNKSKSDLINKILYTLLFITFLIMIIGGIDRTTYNIDNGYLSYGWTYNIAGFIFFGITLYFAIKYVWKSVKGALCTIGISIVSLIISYFIYNVAEENSCDFIVDKLYCHVRGRDAFRGFILGISIIVFVISIIIFFLRLIRGGYKKS